MTGGGLGGVGAGVGSGGEAAGPDGALGVAMKSRTTPEALPMTTSAFLTPSSTTVAIVFRSTACPGTRVFETLAQLLLLLGVLHLGHQLLRFVFHLAAEALEVGAGLFEKRFELVVPRRVSHGGAAPAL